MKKNNVKWGSLVLGVLLLFSSFIQTVSANSAQIYFKGGIGAENMVIAENSPIQVNKERLVFDFEKGEEIELEKHIRSQNLDALVTAEYEMENTSDQPQVVDMIFPFVNDMERTLSFLESDRIKIKDNGKEIPFRLYIANYYEGYESSEYSLQQMLKQIPEEGKNDLMEYIKENQYTVYRFEKDENKIFEDRRFEVAMRVPKASRVFVIGEILASGIEGNLIELDFPAEREAPVLIVVGKKPNFIRNALKSWGGESATDFGEGGKFVAVEEDVEDLLKTSFDEMLEGRIGRQFHDKTELLEQFWSLYCMKIRELWEQGQPMVLQEEIAYGNYWGEKGILLQYQMPFQAHEKREVCVQYPATTYVDMKRETHELRYLFHPAKNWKAFENLEVEIVAPKEFPYLIDSSMKFEQRDGIFASYSKELPDKDFSVTFSNKKKRFDFSIMSYVFLSLIVVLMIYLYRKKRKRDR